MLCARFTRTQHTVPFHPFCRAFISSFLVSMEPSARDRAQPDLTEDSILARAGAVKGSFFQIMWKAGIMGRGILACPQPITSRHGEQIVPGFAGSIGGQSGRRDCCDFSGGYADPAGTSRRQCRATFYRCLAAGLFV